MIKILWIENLKKTEQYNFISDNYLIFNIAISVIIQILPFNFQIKSTKKCWFEIPLTQHFQEP